jgi:Na+/H+ antiporter NhaD/arsenite permease-like protein
MVAMFAGFIISSFVGVPLYVPAVCAAAIAVLVVLSKDRTQGPWVVKRVDWSIIAFFIGLFVVMEGVSVSGLLGEISALFPGFGPGETPTILSLSLFSLVLSNLVSNVPAVMLLSNLMPPDPEILWYVLAGASTLGGNATFLGSAANVIVAESAERYGVEIDLIRLMVIGIPMAAITTGLMIVMLSLF